MTKPLFFVLALVFAESCATQKELTTPQSSEKTLTPAAPSPAEKPFAVLVNTNQSRQFPHLQRHLGQILLANSSNHVLLPVVPPLNSSQSYFPLLTKIYRRDQQNWNAIQWLPRVEINLKGKNGSDLQLIGQDIGQDGPDTVVQSFFRGDNGAEAHVLFTLSADEGLEIRVVPLKDKISWKLRVSRGLGEEHLIPLDKDHVAGLTTSLLPDVMSLVGEQPFASQQDTSFTYLASSTDGSASAFRILFDRNAVLHQAELLQNLIPCYGKAKKSPCGENPGASPAWALSLAAADSDTKLWQQVLFYSKQGSFRALLPIREGETLLVPVSKKLDLFIPDEEGALKPLLLPKKGNKIAIPAMKRGTLSLDSKNQKPSFVEIRDAVRTRGRALASWLPIRPQDLLSPHTFLQSAWPLTTQLPSGDYDIQVFNGTSVLCQQRITIRPGKRYSLDCSDDVSGPAFSPRASLSLDSSLLSPEFISAARIQVATSNSPGSRAGSDLLFEIPSIDVYDADVGLSLRAFPATEEIRKAWENYKKERNEPPGLNAFVDFVRSHDKNLDIVLDCPAAGFQLSEYRWITLSLKPDIIEVFGCQQPELASELLQVAHRLQQKTNKPVRLAAASFFRSFFQSQIPAIYLSRFRPEADPQKNFQRVLQDIQGGQYTLGLRTEILIESPANSSTVRLRIRSYDGYQEAARLRVYDQDDMLIEKPVQLEKDSETNFAVEVPLRPTSRWLRFELLGKENGYVAEEGFLPLATSNFLSLDGGHKNKL